MSDSATPPEKSPEEETKELLDTKELVSSQKNTVKAIVQENEKKQQQLDVIRREVDEGIRAIPIILAATTGSWRFTDDSLVSAARRNSNIDG
jgi:hypothetical protein